MTLRGWRAGGSVGSVAVLATLLALGAGPAAAQGTVGPPASSPGDGSRLTVYLVTMGPGEEVWERFGHNAIYVHDPGRGTDEAYNYGLFDLRQENFLLRFVQGRMWYWMAGFPTERYLQEYVRADRSVWIQELEMPPTARLELQRFLEWNALPENRFYHYDYYRDNCSTRVRDVLDRFLGGRIREATGALPSGATYRFHTQRLTANDPAVFTGLLLGLGQRVDRPISAWEEMFLPMKLRDHVRRVTVPGADGGEVPLVRGERTYYASTAAAPPETPPVWTPWYLLLGLALGGAALHLGGRAGRQRGARIGFGVLFGGWGLLAGVAGVVLAGLWGLTDHVFAYRNENLFQVNPLALLLAGVAPWWVRGRAGAGRLALGAGILVATIAAAGFVLQALPGLDQVNGPIIALALPVHLGVVLGLRRSEHAASRDAGGGGAGGARGLSR